jgi:hypothetical protein
MARLVGSSTAFPVIKRVEEVLAPLHHAIKGIRGADDAAILVDPARELMKVRDELIAHLREGGHGL